MSDGYVRFSLIKSFIILATSLTPENLRSMVLTYSRVKPLKNPFKLLKIHLKHPLKSSLNSTNQTSNIQKYQIFHQNFSKFLHRYQHQIYGPWFKFIVLREGKNLRSMVLTYNSVKPETCALIIVQFLFSTK